MRKNNLFKKTVAAGLVLHLTGTADFIETLPGAHVILAVTFFLVFLTFCLDMRKKEYRKNKLVLRF